MFVFIVVLGYNCIYNSSILGLFYIVTVIFYNSYIILLGNPNNLEKVTLDVC